MNTRAKLRRQRRSNFIDYRGHDYPACSIDWAALVDNYSSRDNIKVMTPTSTQMREPLPIYKVVIRTMQKGLGGIETFKETTPFVVNSRHRVEAVASSYLHDPTVQVRVESDNLIVAVGLYGRLLWLSKVPPPKYWLDHRKRPKPEPNGNERVSACGLRIPERYCPGVSCP